MSARRLVIVGGGITGLAAAWEASSDPELTVTVIEAEHRPGGKIRTTPIELDDGSSLMIDEGADAFLVRVPEALQLCHELGLDDELTHPAIGRAKVVVDGELRFLPQETVLGIPLDADALASAGILSPEGLADATAAIDPGLIAAPPIGDVAIGEFLTERYGRELVDRLVAPLIGGINAGDIDHLSLDAVTPQLADAARDGGSLSRALLDRRGSQGTEGPVFGALLGGSGRLIEALTDSLVGRGVTILTDTPVERILATDDGWRVETTTTLDADRVLLCTPAPPAASALRELSPEAATELASIEHSSVTLVTFVFHSVDVPIELDASGFLVPRGEGLLMTAASWGSSKWAHWNDGRHVILRVSAGRAGDERQAAMNADELVEGLRTDLRTTMGIIAEPIVARVSRWPLGFAQYTVGHLDRVERIDAALRRDCPGVAVAGAPYRGLGLPACIRQGREAARDLTDR